MVNAVVICASLIAGLTLGYVLGLRFAMPPPIRQESAHGGRGTWRALLSVLAAIAIGGFIGAYISFLGVIILTIGTVAMQTIFALAATNVAGNAVAIVAASATSGFMAAVVFTPAMQHLGRLARTTIEPFRWRVPGAAGVGFGFMLLFVPMLGGSRPLSALLGIVAGCVAALACALMLRRVQHSPRDTATARP